MGLFQRIKDDLRTGIATLRLNPRLATVFFNSSTQVSTVAPAGFATGPYHLTIAGADGSATLENAYTVCEPRPAPIGSGSSVSKGRCCANDEADATSIRATAMHAVRPIMITPRVRAAAKAANRTVVDPRRVSIICRAAMIIATLRLCWIADRLRLLSLAFRRPPGRLAITVPCNKS